MSAWLWLPFLLVLVNGAFVLVEYALLRVRSSRLEVLSRKGSRAAKTALDIQSRFDYYLAAIQVGLILTALTLGRLGEPILAGWFRAHFTALFPKFSPRLFSALCFAAALAALTFVTSVFGELLPRSIALRQAEPVALWAAYPLRLFAAAFRAPVAFMSWCSRSLLRLLGLSQPSAESQSLSAEEMRVLIGGTHGQGALALEQLFLLENLFDFGKAVAADAMTPREKIAALSLADPWEKNRDIIRARRFSRYPVCETDLDSIVGFVHVKDLFLGGAPNGAPPDLRRLKREITSVSDSEPLEKLVKILPDRGVRMALVRNALGRVAGLITMEDIVEELIGEVHDEFDLPQAWSLMDVVTRKSVAVDVEAQSREQALRRVVGVLERAHPAAVPPGTLSAVLEREQRFSSVVGHGVAIPHARLAALDKALVAVARLKNPVDFGAADKGPVRLVVLSLTPSAHPVIQLKILKRTASLIANENLRRKLLEAPTAESLFELLRTADTLLAE